MCARVPTRKRAPSLLSLTPPAFATRGDSSYIWFEPRMRSDSSPQKGAELDGVGEQGSDDQETEQPPCLARLKQEAEP